MGRPAQTPRRGLRGDRGTTWAGTVGSWQRIFDFGDNQKMLIGPASGRTYLFLTPRNGETNTLRVAFSLSGNASEVTVDADQALPTGVLTHVAVVVDDLGNELLLYMDGALQGSTTLRESLSSLQDLNNWLGRSQFEMDAGFSGTIHELRLYSIARSAADIEASFSAGPETLPSR